MDDEWWTEQRQCADTAQRNYRYRSEYLEHVKPFATGITQTSVTRARKKKNNCFTPKPYCGVEIPGFRSLLGMLKPRYNNVQKVTAKLHNETQDRIVN